MANKRSASYLPLFLATWVLSLVLLPAFELPSGEDGALFESMVASIIWSGVGANTSAFSSPGATVGIVPAPPLPPPPLLPFGTITAPAPPPLATLPPEPAPFNLLCQLG